MSRIDMITDPSGNPELEQLYAEINAGGFGDKYPINWFTAQAARPDIMRATWALAKGVMLGGRLPATIKQMVVVLVSARNNCDYCRITHARALQGCAHCRRLRGEVGLRPA